MTNREKAWTLLASNLPETLLALLVVFILLSSLLAAKASEAPSCPEENPRVLLSKTVAELWVYYSRCADDPTEEDAAIARDRAELFVNTIGYGNRAVCLLSYADLVKFIPWTLRQNPELLEELAPTLRQILDKRVPEDE